jgi:hypothetical protein
MKIQLLSLVVAVVLIIGNANQSSAQCRHGCGCLAQRCAAGSGIPDNTDSAGIGVGVDQSRWPCSGDRQFTNGNANVTCPVVRLQGYSNLAVRSTLAARDRFHPAPLYAYSRNGIDAARIDQWNRVRSQSTAWHGEYNYWRWNTPAALVVPPTASFQTSYAWGVGNTRSLPINHQFNSIDPGGGSSEGLFAPTPYWPSSTEQLGVYPVRAPWSHIR